MLSLRVFTQHFSTLYRQVHVASHSLVVISGLTLFVLTLSACGGSGGGDDGLFENDDESESSPPPTDEGGETPPRPPNSDPTFDSASITTFVQENQPGTDYTASNHASDPDEDTLIFSLTGGPDQSIFSINGSSGELTFQIPPNYESPMDRDDGNDYVVEVQAADGNGGSATQTVTVNVVDVDEGDDGNESPVFTSDNSSMAPENQTDTGYIAQATDPDGDTVRYSLGGTD